MKEQENKINPIELLKKIMRYRRGEGRYNFSRFDEDIEIKSIEAWEEIEHEIYVCIAQHTEGAE